MISIASKIKLRRCRVAAWTELVLSRVSLAASIAMLVLAIAAIAYVGTRSEGSAYLADEVGALLPDPENRLDIIGAASKFRAKAAIPLEKGGSLRFRTVWIQIDLTGQKELKGRLLSLESLRARNAVFWAVDTDSNVIASRLDWSSIRNGVAVSLPASAPTALRIIGRVEPIAINRVQVSLLDGPQLARQDFAFERTGGMLIGALLMVAFFSLVVALFIRDRTFFLYSAWLVTSLRIAAYNGNWDLYWLQIPITGEPLQLFLRLTYIAHSVISLALFRELFQHELQTCKALKPITALQVATVAMFVPALLLQTNQSIKLLWGLSGATIVVVLAVLTLLSLRAPSRALGWYIGSWLITLAGSLAQIAFSVGLSREFLEIANSQLTAIGSALMLGITLAQRMSAEKQARITAQTSAVNALQRFRENYNAMPVGIFSARHDGTIIEHNPTFGEMFAPQARGRSLSGRNLVDLTSLDALRAVQDQTADGRMMDTEICVERSGAKRRWLHIRAVRKTGRFEGWVEEITARKEAVGQLKFLVDHDSLTGLLNRRGFEMHLQKAIGSSGDRPVCLAYVDLDRFKLVNDLFGHAAGDQILRQLATRMREVIQPPNVTARVGGDEFVVIIDGVSLDEARSLCERLRVDLSERPYQYQDKVFNVAASIGVIRVLDNMRPADALTASDRACSEAKAAGGSSVVAYDSSSSELLNYLDEIKLVAGMKERLPVENFFTQLQPIVSLRTPDASLSYEVLIRMRDNDGQVLPPSRFIPAAERNGLMTQIDRWVLRSTLEWLDSQPAHRDNVDFCTLNLSGASLNDERFLQDTIALIRSFPESTRKICFEITESVALYDLKTTQRFVDHVKSYGAMVALDDFGAGYTSFSYLKDIPGDLVKIDGGFIRDVNLDSANFAITRAIVELAHELGMGCVAEWAENIDTVKALIDLKVDFAQGYGLCRPIDRELLLPATHGLDLVRDKATSEMILARALDSRAKSRRTALAL